MAGVGAALCVALVVWLLVPAGKSGGVSVGAGGDSGFAEAGASQGGTAATSPGAALGGGTAAGGGLAGSTGGPGAGAASGSGGATQAGSSGPCKPPPGSDQGVSATQITLAVILFNAGTAFTNSAVGAAPPSEQQAWAQQVGDYINAHGGVACRKLALQFFTADLADSNNLEATCQNVVATKPFAVVDSAAYAILPLYTCFLSAHLPFFATVQASLSLVTKYQPYLYALQGIYDNLYQNGVLAMKQAGFFDPSKGFKKLGVLYQNCYPDVVQKFFAELKNAGISDNQMTSYDFGCPTLFASPSDIQQAILQFKQAGVTVVTQVNFEVTWSTFTKTAQQETFRPAQGYAMGATSIDAASYGQLAPDPNNANGAIAYVTDRYGEENTPGTPPSPGTQRCDAIFAAYGSPPVFKQGLGVGGVLCNKLLTIQAGLGDAPALTRPGLAAGLMRVGSLQLSFPYGDVNFSGLSFPYGGQTYRAIQFHGACSCWQVMSPFAPLLVKQ